MDKLHLLSKLTSVGVTALSIISFTSITARAADLGTSTLEWDDATTNFNAEMTAILQAGPNPPNEGMFDVTFSPPELGGVAAVFIATGHFEPFFPNLPNFFPINGGNGTTGTFGLVEGGVFNPNPPAAGIDIAAEFELKNDLIFDFGNGVIATLPEESQFLGELRNDGAVELELELGEWEFFIPAINDTPAKTVTAQDSVFEFGDLVGEDGGSYNAEGEFNKVPEPATILGLLAFGGLTLSLKHKKQLLRVG